MTVHRVKTCGCGHPESFHAPNRGPCLYGKGHVMGGCTCPGFGKKQVARLAPVRPATSSAAVDSIAVAIDDVIRALGGLKRALGTASVASAAEVVAVRRAAPTPPTNGAIKLRAGERRMLEVLARHHPTKLTRPQLGTLAGLAASGGTFGTYLGVLVRHALVEPPSELVALTPSGLALAGGPGRPMTRAEIVDIWRSKLRKGERAMLNAVLAEGELTRDELGALAQIETRGGTFGTYLGVLKRNDLVVTIGNKVRLGTALAEAS